MPELKVLSAGAVKTGVAQVADAYARERGIEVKVEFATAPKVRERIASGETPDVVVAPPHVLDELAQSGKVVAATRAFVGRARMGVVVHAESKVDHVGDTDALRQILAAAPAVVRNKASSGIYTEKLLDRLGLTRELGARVQVVDSGADIMNYVAEHGPDAVGLAQISEIRVLIRRGLPIRLAGPLPDAVQNVTAYEAAAVAGGAQPEIAASLARYMAAPEAKALFAASGID